MTLYDGMGLPFWSKPLPVVSTLPTGTLTSFQRDSTNDIQSNSASASMIEVSRIRGMSLMTCTYAECVSVAVSNESSEIASAMASGRSR